MARPPASLTSTVLLTAALSVNTISAVAGTSLALSAGLVIAAPALAAGSGGAPRHDAASPPSQPDIIATIGAKTPHTSTLRLVARPYPCRGMCPPVNGPVD